MSANDDVQNKKLRWACRRGMLELDVLLGNFLNNGLKFLNQDEIENFLILLNSPDPHLFACLLGQEHPQDFKLLPIVEKIRTHVRAKI